MALACHLFTREHVGYVQDTASSLLTQGPFVLFNTLTPMSVPLLNSWLPNHRHCSASKHEPLCPTTVSLPLTVYLALKGLPSLCLASGPVPDEAASGVTWRCCALCWRLIFAAMSMSLYRSSTSWMLPFRCSPPSAVL